MTPSPPGLPTGPRSTHASRRDTARFLREILRHSRQIGAVSPSGPHLAGQAAELITQRAGPQVVVEIGPGSGAITDALAARLPAGSTLVGVEVNAAMVAHLEQTRPWLQVIHGDAADLPDLLHAADIPPVDLIVSALPWSLIPPGTQHRIVRGIASVLHPDGTFATVSTLPVRNLPGTRQMRRELRAAFAVVDRTRTVWRNLPPAHLYVCRHPRLLRTPVPVSPHDGPQLSGAHAAASTDARRTRHPGHRAAGAGCATALPAMSPQ